MAAILDFMGLIHDDSPKPPRRSAVAFNPFNNLILVAAVSVVLTSLVPPLSLPLPGFLGH